MSSKSFQNASKLNGIVSVLQFGAVGDGIADDTAAIQAAINYASSVHVQVFLPAGTYRLNTAYPSGLESLAIGPYCLRVQNTSGFSIVGEGIGVTKLITGNSASLSHQLFLYNCSNFQISGIECIGNNTGLTVGQNNGAIFLFGVSNFSVQNIKTSIFQGSQFVGDWWWDGEFTNIYQNVPEQASGFDVAFLQNIKINNQVAVGTNAIGQGFQCSYDIPNVSSNPTGLTLNYGMTNNVRISNSNYTRFNVGVYFEEARDIWIEGNNFYDNYKASGDYTCGVLFDMHTAATGYNINLVNNTFSKNGTGSGTAGYRGGVFLNAGTGPLQVFSQNNKYIDNKDSGIFVYNGISVFLQSLGDYFGNTTTTNQTKSIANTPVDLTQVSYTPVVTTTSGTITSYTANGLYKLIGNTCILKISISITNNGTGAGLFNVTLPIPHRYNGLGSVFYGKETAATGVALTGFAAISATTFSISNVSGTYPAATGYVLVGTLIYEI
jgi:hypothetical protein